MANSQPPPAAPNRFERRRQQNRAALIEAAIELFQLRGVRETKVEDICARADVAPRTFFNHFETREHLYQAIASRRAARLAATIDSAREDPALLAARLGGLFEQIGAYLDARPRYREMVGLMLSRGAETGNETVRSGAIGRAALRFVEDGLARGEVGSRHAPEVLADLIVGALDTALSNWSSSHSFSLARELPSTARALCDLLTLDAPDAPSN